MSEPPFLLFSGTSHRGLAEEIAKKVGAKVGKAQIELFPDGEIGVQVFENVRGREVFVVQSIAKQPNFYLMELLILIDALKRASARSIVAVIPYFGYARQDRKDKRRVPITAKLVANLLETAGAHRVVTMDLHSEQIQGFFDIPVENLYGQGVLAEGIDRWGLEDPVVCAPDVGSVKLARSMATEIGAKFVIVDKERMSANDVEVYALIGDVQGKDVILVDDICSTGRTLKKASRVLKEAGAARVFAAVTHSFLGPAQVKELGVERFLATNTLPMPNEIDHGLLEILSVSGVFGKAIEHIAYNGSISSLFSP